METPHKLYKYESISVQSLRNLKNNTIYFNSPQNFNDPLEVSHHINLVGYDEPFIKTVLLQDDEERVRVFDALFSNRPNIDDLIDATINLVDVSDYARIQIENYFKYKEGESLEEKIKDYIGISYGFNTLVSIMKDLYYETAIFSFEKALHDIRSDYSSKIGISCFSEVFDNFLMWSHYSKSHTGFCLEFDTSYNPFEKVKKVEYIKNPLEIDVISLIDNLGNPAKHTIDFFCTKLENWSYEKEWRILHKSSGTEFTYKNRALSAIYFGSQTSFEDIQIICSIIIGQNPACKFYKMKMIKNKLEAKEFEYTPYIEIKKQVAQLMKDHANDKDKVYTKAIEKYGSDFTPKLFELILSEI